MSINNGRARQIIQVNGEDYHVFSQFFDEEYMIYRNFMVSKEADLVGMYKLGVTKVALQIYNHKNEFDPPAWLFELGLEMLHEMIVSNNFQKESGIITSHELSKDQVNWQQLEPLSLTEEYHR
ncbi:MAG: hypothetical protein SCK28_08065 [Bacillota bacterium]|nr:hypothetical protein [Bacillota bacterium]